MATIRILPDILANKIAAGEVVERPASVVKELVENALDAGSTRILIDIQKGGRSLIQVADNGCGMTPDDALMALERFATSKINDDQDLFAIKTLGFRGEALPSMAAVSKMTLVSFAREAPHGIQIEIHGGKILKVTETGAPPGTMVRLAQLFYNTPARRKFLKSISTEMNHIMDTVAGMALAHHGVHFQVSHNDKILKQWPRTSHALQRVEDVLGPGGPERLIELEIDEGSLNVRGFLGSARQARSTTRGIYLFVNGRRVRDHVIQHGLLEGYRGRLMKGRFPVAVLFARLPYDQVDVNVHPTKHEIRLADGRWVHDAVRDGVARALGRNDRLSRPGRDAEQEEEADHVAQEKPVYPSHDRPVTVTYRDPVETRPPVQLPEASPPDPLPEIEDMDPVDTGTALENMARSAENRAVQSRPAQRAIWENGRFADLTVIGQFRGTYVICQDGDDLVLIDQHAAHERIVYERLAEGAGTVESQRLLMPETVELGFGEAEALGRLIPALDKMGLEIEPFGGTTFAIKAIPTLLDDRDIASLVSSVAEKAAETPLTEDLSRVLDDCRKEMACHNAVRANQRLTETQINEMLAGLDRCGTPSHCPHGRPTWVRWTLRELEKAFKRIV